MVSANGFQPETILVTGGAGYIGSHCTLQLLLAGYKVVIVDNLSNSSEEAIKRVASLAGGYCNNLSFFKVDLCVKEQLEMVFLEKRFDAVIHFAGLKAVGESVEEPLRYYCNNVIGTLNLLRLMDAYGCKKLVFSSSATVYGQPKSVPCTEEFPLEALNPYGRTKLYIEQICKDVQKADPGWKIILLRYFNPVAAHPSGTIGEDPKGIPNNLMPFVQQVAVGRRKELTVYGNDYPTRDGTGVRDYIHVMDLVDGHVAALTKIFSTESAGLAVYNLGTGQGTSVLEMVAAFENASGKKIPLKIAGRRAGDSAEIYACTAKAEKELGWKANYGIEEMARDQWNWARKNPWGYQSNENGNSDRLQENGYSDNGLHGNGVKNQENRNGENGDSDRLQENGYSDNGLHGNGVKNQENRNGDHGLHGNGNSDHGLHGNGIKNQENGNSDHGLHRNGVKNYF